MNQQRSQNEPKMKAVIFDRYGGPEVLQVTEVPIPEMNSNQVLVKNHASTLNSADYRMMSATPFLVRFYAGLLRPNKLRILGADVAGTVEQVGTDVVHFKPGDRVMADAFKDNLGAFAEYTLIHESELVHIPEKLDYNEAATIPLAAVTALQGVRDSAEIKPGDEVLIQGAGGGVGFFIIQIAKEFGAKVTAVCGPGSMEMVQSVHPDRIINYQEIDFTSEEKQYDVIIGVNGYHTLGEYKRCLKTNGRYVMIGGNGRGFLMP